MKTFNELGLKDAKAMMGHEITLEGLVDIKNGGNHVKAKNKVTSPLLITICNYLCGYRALYDPSGYGSGYWYGTYYPAYGFNVPGTGGYMKCGHDTTTATTPDMTDLQNIIGPGSGTKADTTTMGPGNPSAGTYDLTFTGVWSRGTISGTFGECGLFLYLYNVLKAGNWTLSLNSTNAWVNDASLALRMAARLSAADGEFTAFTIDTNEPTIINWTFRFSFV